MTLKNVYFYVPTRRWHRGSQRHCLTVNVQLWCRGTNIALFYKIKDPIHELNYWGTKYKIGAKVGDQKCNLVYVILQIDLDGC